MFKEKNISHCSKGIFHLSERESSVKTEKVFSLVKERKGDFIDQREKKGISLIKEMKSGLIDQIEKKISREKRLLHFSKRDRQLQLFK